MMRILRKLVNIMNQQKDYQLEEQEILRIRSERLGKRRGRFYVLQVLEVAMTRLKYTKEGRESLLREMDAIDREWDGYAPPAEYRN